MKKQWISPDWDVRKIEALAAETNLPNSISAILINRGIESLEQAKLFFNPSQDQFHDPFSLKDMDIAVDLILDHIKRKSHILIYGDYDVDGTTAASILYLALSRLGGRISYYIPERLEGYGLSRKGIEESHQVGVNLIVSCDCGITALDEAQLASSYGIDLIISDHHEVGTSLPRANAILNPKRQDSGYPFRFLSGVGVALKIVQALMQKTGSDDPHAMEYIDLAAIGTSADIVPMYGENRVITALGIPRVTDGERVGLKALLQVARLKKDPLEVSDVVFGIAPRINAIGRLASARKAVELFTTNDPVRAVELANEFERKNNERRTIDQKTFELAEQQLLARYQPEFSGGFVLADSGWHQGVIGIVASRLMEKYYRPVVLISFDGDEGRGSGRSIEGFNLYDALSKCSDLLIGFGGHERASGLSIKKENLRDFIDRFEEFTKSNLHKEFLVLNLEIEGVLALSEITPKLIKVSKRLAPFGSENMRPVFASYGVKTQGTPYIVGENHLKFKVRQHSLVFDAIAFNMAGDFAHITNGKPYDIAYVLNENEWQGNSTLQLVIKDIH